MRSTKIVKGRRSYRVDETANNYPKGSHIGRGKEIDDRGAKLEEPEYFNSEAEARRRGVEYVNK